MLLLELALTSLPSKLAIISETKGMEKVLRKRQRKENNPRGNILDTAKSDDESRSP
jgi:hypothetical protein